MFSLVNMLQNVKNLKSILEKSYQCPTKSQWHITIVYDITVEVCEDTTFNFNGPHPLCILNDYSVSTNSGDLEPK